MRLASEPLRLRTLTILSERPASLGEIADGLRVSMNEAGNLLEEMHAAGLVELEGEVLGREAIEPCYRAAVRVLWTDEEWAELSLAERRRVSAWIVHTINEEVKRWRVALSTRVPTRTPAIPSPWSTRRAGAN